jgi:UTP--glucose-1-phosphate uridylyltransferase
MTLSPPGPARGSLHQQLEELPASVRDRLRQFGFDAAALCQRASTLDSSRTPADRAARNRIEGPVRAPALSELCTLPERGTAEASEVAAIGNRSIANGEVALCVMAGGMATRMGGVVKALVEVFPGQTFLDLRLAAQRTISKQAGRSVPLWLMTSDATHEAIRTAYSERALDGEHVELFPQAVSLRLNADGSLFVDADGNPSPYATGHGDLLDAIKTSGALERFAASGGKYVWVTNLDNLGATLDAELLGYFIRQQWDLCVEVCPKVAGDRGGVPVHADGRLQVLEEFRLPSTFNPSEVPVFNTNTFLMSIETIRQATFPWTYFEVEKLVDGKRVIQFERLLQEVTAHTEAHYIQIPRDGATSRFLPVKDFDELAKRLPTLREVALRSGMLQGK